MASVSDVALAKKRLSFSRPDAVLLDLYLDGPEGFALLGSIKQKYPDLPVIIVTAYDSFEEDPRLCLADGYVVKSLDLNGLKSKIVSVVGRKLATQISSKGGFRWPYQASMAR